VETQVQHRLAQDSVHAEQQVTSRRPAPVAIQEGVDRLELDASAALSSGGFEPAVVKELLELAHRF
jgi:hypothetical protein